MKTVVSVNEISEFEIKPKDQLIEWKQLVAKEMAERWSDERLWVIVECPVCSSHDSNNTFVKQGFSYAECAVCKTLYAQNRPSVEELNWWYTSSRSVESWQNTLLRSSAESREAKIIEPRANWILDGLSEYMPNCNLSTVTCTDISFFGKSLLEKIGQYVDGMQLTAAGITAKNEQYETGNVVKDPVLSINSFSGVQKTDVLIAIDVFERVPSIHQLLTQLERIVNPGGLVFATCPVSSGFEIQSLWDKSVTITQPDKLNLPSVKGLVDYISSSAAWDIMELSTPGMFDVELVHRAMIQFPDEPWPRSLHALLDGIDPNGVERFTEYLQSQLLSSFARIVLKRRDKK
jgi:2-polyprenyl-3-methyl-5-hydroxy-6-metoxy-1,4-benzoquinol methylase